MAVLISKLGRASRGQDAPDARVTQPEAAVLPPDKSPDSPLPPEQDSPGSSEACGIPASSGRCAKHDDDATASSGSRAENPQPWPQKPSQAKYADFSLYHATSSNSPRYMVKNAKDKANKLPFEQPTLDDAEFETLTKLMDDKQKHTVPSFKSKTALRILYFVLLAAVVYFVLVGWPIWPGAVVWFWRWYQGETGQHHIAGLVAFLVAGLIRSVLPQFLCTFDGPGAEPDTADENQGASQCCVIIPCYKAAETLRSTLPACLAIFGPRQIFVVANGNSSVPLDNTADVCSEFGVRHVWLPVGSKITAEFVGVTLGREFQYCLLIDDDVLLPPSLPILTQWFTAPGHENVACVGYTIKSVGANSSRGTLMQQAQDLEYKIAGLTKVFQARYGSAIFPHGAVALWRRDVLETILRAHPGYSISEDWWLGHTARAAGYRILMSSAVFVETETPPHLFPACAAGCRSGYGEMSVVQQRFFRWSFFYLFRIWANTLYLIFSWRLGWRVLVTKLYVLGECYDTLIKLFTPVFLPVAMMAHWRLTLSLWFGTILANLLLSCWFNLVHLRLLRRRSPTKEQVSWLAFPAFFLIKFVMAFVTVASVYWTIYQYAVFFTRQHLRVTESVPAWKVIREKHESIVAEEPALGNVPQNPAEASSHSK